MLLRADKSLPNDQCSFPNKEKVCPSASEDHVALQIVPFISTIGLKVQGLIRNLSVTVHFITLDFRKGHLDR